MKHLKFFAALCCVAAVFTAMSITFVSCKKDKTDDPKDPTDIPLVYTLTVLSLNEEMGTVTGSGTYEEGTEVTLTATPTSEEYVFVRWSDNNTSSQRVIKVIANETYTAYFDARPSTGTDTDTEDNHEWVDLGLGVKWATCNVGATKPEEYGNYYAWGATETRGYYYWNTYKYGSGWNELTKYCTKSRYGKYGYEDNKTMLELADDAARANLGGAWRMPTDAEWTELRENCTWTWTTLNGKRGYEVKGANGNSIFLPAAGFRGCNELNEAGGVGRYWSSALNTDSPFNAWSVSFDLEHVYRYYSDRFYGQSVRAVCE